MGAIPTVKVCDGKAYKVINECDFDPDVHKLFELKPRRRQAKTAKPKSTAGQAKPSEP